MLGRKVSGASGSSAPSLCYPRFSLNAREGIRWNWDDKIPETDNSGHSRFHAVWASWWQSIGHLLKVTFCFWNEICKVAAMYVLSPALLERWRGLSLTTIPTPSSLVARVIFVGCMKQALPVTLVGYDWHRWTAWSCCLVSRSGVCLRIAVGNRIRSLSVPISRSNHRDQLLWKE